MAANEKLVERVRNLLQDVKHVKEKKMFSGLTFMVNGKMCISVGPDRLMFRIDPAFDLSDKHESRPVVMRGKVMKGYVHVYEDALQSKTKLKYWTQLALKFNPFAKSSRE